MCVLVDVLTDILDTFVCDNQGSVCMSRVKQTYIVTILSEVLGFEVDSLRVRAWVIVE